jgi:DnaA family protein
VAQLPLAVGLADHARFETFVAGANGSAVAHLRAAGNGAAEVLWIWGAASTGKSHLLQAACHAATVAGHRAMYVPLGTALAAEPGILAGLETVDVLAIDAAERVAADADWERTLFALLNGVRERRGTLVLAARTAPAASGFRLPDLASRVAGAVTYRLQPLDHEGRVLALLAHAGARGLDLERPAAEYLLNRVDRDMAGLVRWLDRLDRESLVEQRRVTIPFIRELLAIASDERA